MAGVSSIRAGAQSPTPSPSPAQQASFRDSAIQSGASTVHFARQAARVGDEVEQSVSLEMRLTTLVRQQNQVLDQTKTTMRVMQRRAVTTTEVEAGRITAVAVRYLEATKQLTASGNAAASEPSPPTAQPVQGKAYRCRREAGDGGRLVITDEQGQTPPAEEHEIVAQNMEMIGRNNPLADFLAGQSIAVGQTIALPKDVAERLFNLGERFGEVQRFDLTLEEASVEEGTPCALFRAHVEAASNDSSQMRMEVAGPLVVQVDTCRSVRTSLSGPIGMSETRGSYSVARQLIGTGQLNMSIASRYRDTAR